MRILHFSTEDITGGAARAAYRLHTALREAGHQSELVVLSKKSDDDSVVQAPFAAQNPWIGRLQRLRNHIPGLRRALPVANYTFNFDTPSQADLHSLLVNQKESPDIVCLHWINGFLDVRSIRRIYDFFRCPIVWVMADQEALTGGCHYSFGCEGFKSKCGNCPQLTPPHRNDHSHLLWQRKSDLLAELPICFVAPTSWCRNRLQESSLFGKHRCEQIPYPIDPQIFRPFDRKIARDLLHLPQDRKIIFFGATYLEDRRKGMAQLLNSMEVLAAQTRTSELKNSIYLLVAGLNGKQLMNRLPFHGKYIGHLQDELTLALAYQAADLFVCPSLEDAGPMMIPEAMMCGTPVVAFNTGGAPDLIETGKTGYLASLADSEDFAAGILFLLEADNGKCFRDAAHFRAREMHSPGSVVQKHLNLYQTLSA